MRHTIRVLGILAVGLVVAAGVAAAAPHATPFPGLPGGGAALANGASRAMRPARATGAFTNPVQAALAVGNRIVNVQSDVTEDNAGNGNPDADWNDGGWDWEITGATQHPASASYENLYGPIAAGLVDAAIATGDARLATGVGDVFAGIARSGNAAMGTPYVGIWDGGLLAACVRWTDHTGDAAVRDTMKNRFDVQWLGFETARGSRALYVRNGRAAQGLSGLWPWDILGCFDDCMALAGAYPAADYGVRADSIAQVLADDMNGLLGATHFDPNDHGMTYHELGVMGALAIFDRSPRTDDDAYVAGLRDQLIAEQATDGTWALTYGGEIYPQDQQGTAYGAMILMDYGRRHGDAVAVAAAEKAQAWLLAQVQADGSVPDAWAQEWSEGIGEVVSGLLSGDEVAPQPPATCITPAHPCVEVPVTIARAGAGGIRGFSVTLQLSSNLAACGAGIVEGAYLSAVGATHFEVRDLGGGLYTVDGAILGLPCGATAAGGTLFTVNVASGATGTGTVTLTRVVLRDCDNVGLAPEVGAPATITLDNTVPAAIAALAAAQVKAGNDGDGTTAVGVSWPAVEAGATVHVYRASYGNYPEYDDLPGAGAVPATPAYPPGAPWALAGSVASGTSLADEVAGRGFWYYVAFVEDACGNVSSVSNKTTGTLNYFLGDVHDGIADCQGDDRVQSEDVSFLGAHYGAALGLGDALGCLDVGPTTDGSVDARPMTDDVVDFEDLMMFAINWHQVSAPQAGARPVAAGADGLRLEVPAAVSAGATFPVTLHIAGAGGLLGVSTRLGWDPAVAEPVSVATGALLQAQGGVALSARPGTVDAAVFRGGIAGDGVLATVTFRALASGDPRVTIASADARDAGNRRVPLAGTAPAGSFATALAPAAPNPFARATTLSFTLARAGRVELSVYGVDGRKVATLADGTFEAGLHQAAWDGRDTAGRIVRPGLYYARLSTGQTKVTRAVVVAR